ncbi:XRE family transcriptional regulator [Alistipes sp. An66]|uniref:XRE family transcriptional regulator n=1 Tax=Alistipes sp. An66 TaxID=1965650 RepID=UPI001EF57118|nr:XRE family transcriptional regulator [Alistipes sp. An66]
MIHIGNLIEKEFRRQERSVSWLAKKLFCERTNIYDIFKRQSIDTEMLLRISEALHHDFFQYYRSSLEKEIPTATTPHEPRENSRNDDSERQ